MDDKAPHCITVSDGETRLVAAYERGAPGSWYYGEEGGDGAYRLPAGYKIIKDDDEPDPRTGT